ncbi:hypothetical protein [Streptosporangium sp. NPDC002524]|uniref:hypothetical protein n=1 Tax=Streptosporangium sp. NPDC002524 TaxID=3154537 RepID=UPI00332BBE63
MQKPGASGTDGGTSKADLDVRAHHKKVQIRLAVASDPATPPETLEAMATDPSRTVRRALAARTDAPGKVLRALAQDPDLKTRQSLAKNPSCPSGALITLVEDPHWSVRWSVPEHPAANVEARRTICRSADEVLRGLLAEQDGLDEETNSVLAVDPSPNVRARLAAHTDAPDILAALIADADPKVRAGATENPITTTNQHRLLSTDKFATVRKAALMSEKLPRDELQRLAHDRSVEVRWRLAIWPTTPETVLRVLAEDPHPDVVASARARLGENT